MIGVVREWSRGGDRAAELGVFCHVVRARSNSTSSAEVARSSEADVRPMDDSDSVEMREIASIPLENTSITLGTVRRLKVGSVKEPGVGEGGSTSLKREGRVGKKESSDAGICCVG